MEAKKGASKRPCPQNITDTRPKCAEISQDSHKQQKKTSSGRDCNENNTTGAEQSNSIPAGPNGIKKMKEIWGNAGRELHDASEKRSKETNCVIKKQRGGICHG